MDVCTNDRMMLGVKYGAAHNGVVALCLGCDKGGEKANKNYE
jgi:hypothetical protein